MQTRLEANTLRADQQYHSHDKTTGATTNHDVLHVSDTHQTPGLRASCYGVLNKVSEITKRSVSCCLTNGFYYCAGLLSPVFSWQARPTLFGRKISWWRQLTTVLWSLESEGFHKNRLAVVLKNNDTGNAVVRSSLPLDKDGTLVLPEILKELNQKPEFRSEEPLTEGNVHLQLYTLNNRICEDTEWEQLHSEVERLNMKGVSIDFKPSPISGALFGAPAFLPVWMQRLYQKIPYYLTWTHFPALIDQLQKELETKSETGKRKVSLVHCAHGIDRTGAVCASLKMKNGESYQRVREEAQAFARTRSGYLDVDSYSHYGMENFATRLKLQDEGHSLGDIQWHYQRKAAKQKSH